jgi:uncharacterized protein
MKIPILHLEEGYHHIEGMIKAGSLHFYRDTIYPNDVNIEVDLNKFEKNISCHISISTIAHFECDRCLSEFDQDIIESQEILFHLGPQGMETDEENVIHISPEVKDIDITPYIEETLIVSIPMKQTCKQDCKGFCSGCGADLNIETCSCTEQSVDSRWEKLQEIRKQDKK